MSNYKSVQIQILNITNEGYTDCLNELGCYYSIIKEESKLIDVTILTDTNVSVYAPVYDKSAIINITIKNLSDKTIIGSIPLQVKQLLKTEKSQFIEEFTIDITDEIRLKLSIQFTLSTKEMSQASPLKSSLDNSQQYSLISESFLEQEQDGETEFQLNHELQQESSQLQINNNYVTMGQESTQVTIFPTSPTFKQMKDMCIQVEMEEIASKKELDMVSQKYEQSQRALLQLQRECGEVVNINKNFEKQHTVLQEEISRLQGMMEGQKRELLIKQNERKPQVLDDALIEQIRKLKQQLKSQEEQNQGIVNNLQQVNYELEDKLKNLQNKYNQLEQKQQRNDSISQLAEEQNKYIIDLNSKLSKREKELYKINIHLQSQIQELEYQLQDKTYQFEKLQSKLEKEQLYFKILNVINESKLEERY